MEVDSPLHDFSKARTQVWKHMLVFMDSMCLRCAIELGVPDAIHNHDGPMTLSELVQALPMATTRAPFLRRIMRVLVNSGFFSIKGNESDGSNEEEVYYDLTATSKLLVTGSTTSLAPLVLFVTGMEVAMAGHAMTTWIKASDDDDKNETPFHVAHGGKSVFEFASERPEFNALLNEGMACDNRVFIGEVVKNWGDVLFGGLQSLVDVGGGTGLTATVIAGAFPKMKCSVLELDHVVDVQPENELVEFVRGDMFVQIPQADAFLLEWVLHDWSDKDCVKILRNCKKSFSCEKNKGKVIIIDAIVQPNSNDLDTIQAHYLFDTYMLAMCPGKERNAMEWKAIFNEVGFSGFKIVGELGIHSIIEVYH
ncbi:trans-resveratrol di-O-methyltransferase-like [Dioscorea cayenensis subsp. rotundata]|uniref:Trans-resveratrol di-O-methyltransferase-like n=1 Tax=Dioscorea cayennensis subsp. rotundata TaxID=55577 RepID=A0AB40AH66_DIOCR|nr:trans-resveratrol di-O-methyltransferase-like [Dioscorea cayenensis subsp. rotundata]